MADEQPQQQRAFVPTLTLAEVEAKLDALWDEHGSLPAEDQEDYDFELEAYLDHRRELRRLDAEARVAQRRESVMQFKTWCAQRLDRRDKEASPNLASHEPDAELWRLFTAEQAALDAEPVHEKGDKR